MASRRACTIGMFTRQGLQVFICIRHLCIGSVFLLLLLLLLLPSLLLPLLLKLLLFRLLLLLSLQQQATLHVCGEQSVLDTKIKDGMRDVAHICRWQLVTCWQMISLLQNSRPGHRRDLHSVWVAEHLLQAC